MIERIDDTFSLKSKLEMNPAAIRSAIDQHKITYGRLFERYTTSSGRRLLRPVSDNTVVLGGAIIALEKLCGVAPSFIPPTLNTIYNLPVTGTSTVGESEYIMTFGVGTGGSGTTFGTVVDPDIKQKNVIDMVPFRYGEAIPATDPDYGKYFFKVENTQEAGTYSWYLKRFDAATTIKSYWQDAVDQSQDGTEITTDISGSASTDGIETLAQFQFSLNIKDVREYFDAIGQLSSARYNTIGFFTGEFNSTDGEYANVRLFSVVTFNNKSVVEETESEYVYRVYSLI